MNPTRKPTSSAIRVLDDPRSAGEVLEPQAQEQRVEAPPAPPVVDPADEAAVVGLDRAAEAELGGHRDRDPGEDRGGR